MKATSATNMAGPDEFAVAYLDATSSSLMAMTGINQTAPRPTRNSVVARRRRLANVLTRMWAIEGSVIGTIMATIINSQPKLTVASSFVVNHLAGVELHRNPN